MLTLRLGLPRKVKNLSKFFFIPHSSGLFTYFPVLRRPLIKLLPKGRSPSHLLNVHEREVSNFPLHPFKLPRLAFVIVRFLLLGPPMRLLPVGVHPPHH